MIALTVKLNHFEDFVDTKKLARVSSRLF